MLEEILDLYFRDYINMKEQFIDFLIINKYSPFDIEDFKALDI